MSAAQRFLILCLCQFASLSEGGVFRHVNDVNIFEGMRTVEFTDEASIWKTPDFCHNLQCPKYVTKMKTETFELRCYQDYHWVSTNVSDLDFDKASGEAFGRLFKYISGDNEKKMHIEMTAPVALHIAPGQGPFCASKYTMSFFVPFELQNDPPTPSASNVFLSHFPRFCAYVNVFPGYAHQDDIIKSALILTEDLKKAGIHDYISDTYFFAGYDSPFRPKGRHNEIWFLQK